MSAGAAIVALALVSASASAQLPESALAIDVRGSWRGWWSSASAPRHWRAASPVVSRAIRWRPASPGVSVAELRIAGSGEAWRLRVIMLRIDPRVVTLRPVFADGDTSLNGKWNVTQAGDVSFAVNAGQFAGSRPWGWVMRDGRELQVPGYGPLSSALVVDTAGAVHITPWDSLAARRAAGVRHAFQSYPAILERDGDVPAALQSEGLGVDLRHRDARLAIGMLRDSTLLIALTRFEGLGGVLDVLPFGLTTPEMAALMGALGCSRAMLLDGGISGQLAVRDSAGVTRRWPGLRNVPMGLVGTTR